MILGEPPTFSGRLLKPSISLIGLIKVYFYFNFGQMSIIRGQVGSDFFSRNVSYNFLYSLGLLPTRLFLRRLKDARRLSRFN